MKHSITELNILEVHNVCGGSSEHKDLFLLISELFLVGATVGTVVAMMLHAASQGRRNVCPGTAALTVLLGVAWSAVIFAELDKFYTDGSDV